MVMLNNPFFFFNWNLKSSSLLNDIPKFYHSKRNRHKWSLGKSMQFYKSFYTRPHEWLYNHFKDKFAAS